MYAPTTKKELAKAYSPDLEPKVAGQHLKRLIHSCSSLMKALKRLDILKLKKNLRQAEIFDIQTFRTSIK